jgi:presenilin-like A22 family membrane protease
MYALCVRTRVRPWVQERTQIAILVLVVIILTLTALKGWSLVDVAAVVMAAGAASAPDRRPAS